MASGKKCSFEQSRNDLVGRVSSYFSAPAVTKRAPFQNNDVPEFLARLKKAEKDARKKPVIVNA